MALSAPRCGCLLPGGVCSGGSALGGVYPTMHWGRHPPCGQTDACKNITFATSLRTVIIQTFLNWDQKQIQQQSWSRQILNSEIENIRFCVLKWRLISSNCPESYVTLASILGVHNEVNIISVHYSMYWKLGMVSVASWSCGIKAYSHLRFIRRELLRELFRPYNHKKWAHNPLF